jgi:hypothetical protein
MKDSLTYVALIVAMKINKLNKYWQERFNKSQKSLCFVMPILWRSIY